MFKKLALTTLFLSALTTSMPSSALADNQEGSFSFSDALQTSLDSLAEARDSLRSEIDAAISGLKGDEARDVHDAYKDDVEALHQQSHSLQSEVRAEMEAAGITPSDRGTPLSTDAPSNEKDGAYNGPAGGAGGRGGAGGEGPGGHGGAGGPNGSNGGDTRG